jgi:hypothetical protein
MLKKAKLFASEVELCAAFLAAIPKDWTAYAETEGWDILLVRNHDGFQIGIQAKLRLGVDVINQALEGGEHYRVGTSGPDCRAVLVPSDGAPAFDRIAGYIGFTIIRMYAPSGRPSRWGTKFTPTLPDNRFYDKQWYELMPVKRHKLPAYVPDVRAGSPSPVQLTDWKISAIKIAVTIELRGFVTREDFKHVQIDHRRFTARDGWLTQCHCGAGWFSKVSGMGFDRQHPKVYVQVRAEATKWMRPVLTALLPA